jgi:hypothetical protein
MGIRGSHAIAVPPVSFVFAQIPGSARELVHADASTLAIPMLPQEHVPVRESERAYPVDSALSVSPSVLAMRSFSDVLLNDSKYSEPVRFASKGVAA